MHAVVLLAVVNAQCESQLADMMTLLVGKVMKAYSLRIILEETLEENYHAHVNILEPSLLPVTSKIFPYGLVVDKRI